NSAPEAGGAVSWQPEMVTHDQSDFTSLVEGCTFLNNTARLDTDINEGGGAIFLNGGQGMVVRDSDLSFNQGKSGGAIFWVGNGSTLQLIGSRVEGNRAASKGGGAVAYGTGRVELMNTRMAWNHVESGDEAGRNDGGGGLYIDDYLQLTLAQGSAVMYNSVAGQGGGVHLEGFIGMSMCEGSRVAFNTAQSHGGGIYGGDNVSIAVINASIQGNFAGASLPPLP
ncbi:hypothetical protein CYMTET_37916, partial [Cymbomonas tetramitiformis]